MLYLNEIFRGYEITWFLKSNFIFPKKTTQPNPANLLDKIESYVTRTYDCFPQQGLSAVQLFESRSVVSQVFLRPLDPLKAEAWRKEAAWTCTEMGHVLKKLGHIMPHIHIHIHIYMKSSGFRCQYFFLSSGILVFWFLGSIFETCPFVQ